MAINHLHSSSDVRHRYVWHNQVHFLKGLSIHWAFSGKLHWKQHGIKISKVKQKILSHERIF
jgi:hypothetical protein